MLFQKPAGPPADRKFLKALQNYRFDKADILKAAVTIQNTFAESLLRGFTFAQVGFSPDKLAKMRPFSGGITRIFYADFPAYDSCKLIFG